MSKRIPKLLIIDMLESVNNILQYTEGMTFESFLGDSKTKDAVLRNVQVLGEAANRTPKEIQTNYTEIEWNKIIRSRHIVSHEYASINYETIWKIITIHFTSIKTISPKNPERS